MREAREERGVSISEVAEQTRISPLYIDSIEKDNYKPLPGGIFNKGFVKSYAKYVGVDEQEALRDYADLVSHTEETEIEQPRSYRPEVLSDDKPIAMMMPTIFIAGVILAVMSAAILVLVNYVRNRESGRAVVSNATNVQPSPEQTTQIEKPATNAGSAAFEASKIDFRVSGPVSLSSTVDGKSSEAQVEPSQDAEFSPKDNLRLKYHISRVNFVSLLINGKQIELPRAPLDPKRTTIELEINRNNFPQILESGRYVAPQGAMASGTPKPAPTQRPAAGGKPSPPPARPGASTTPKPGNTAVRPTPR